MKLVWTPAAAADLAEIRRYVARNDPRAAKQVVAQVRKVILGVLPRLPDAGRPGRISGTRELVVPRTPYVVPYRVVGETVEVLRVYHGARRWPDTF